MVIKININQFTTYDPWDDPPSTPPLPNTAEVPPSDDDEEHICQIVQSKEFCQHFLHSWRGSGFLIYLLNLDQQLHLLTPFRPF